MELDKGAVYINKSFLFSVLIVFVLFIAFIGFVLFIV